MEIARIFRCNGWTLGQYDELIKRMDLGEGSAPGVLFHWAAATDDGVLAVDVYESRETADRLAAEKIGPLCGELGLAMPEVEEHSADRILTPANAPAA
jgi:hypothetical protein